MDRRAIEGLMNAIGAVRIPVEDDEQEHDHGYRTTLPVDGQKANLLDLLADYREAKGKPVFKTGDFVHPKPNTAIKGHGLPHIVLETRMNAEPYWTDSPSSVHNGNRLDMRVAVMVKDDTIMPYWVESWQYVPFVFPEE